MVQNDFNKSSLIVFYKRKRRKSQQTVKHFTLFLCYQLVTEPFDAYGQVQKIKKIHI